MGKALTRLNGMFAFAVVGIESRTLTLARDRFGEKPPYYGQFDQILLFGSELRALRAHPSFAASLDRDAIATYFLRNCIPAPWTAYLDVSKLPPGSLLTVPLGVAGAPAAPTRYWDALDVAQRAQANPFTAAIDDAADMVGQLLGNAVALRMEADVPLGAFLSGGIDSTSIAALMQEHSANPIRTFTIGYDNGNIDESRYARAIADHLGTRHTELRLSPADALRAIPEMPKVYDEPFSDSSQLPAYLLSRFTSEHVKVALSGDGGDEVFGGYNRHVWAAAAWRGTQWYPASLRRGLARAATGVSPATWERVARVAPRRLRGHLTTNKISKLAQVVSAESPAEAYRRLISHWPTDGNPVFGGAPYRGVADSVGEWPNLGEPTEQMMALDSVSYLPDDILVKVDRATMAHSLATRVPMLDHRLYELAWSLPLDLKVSNGMSKLVLREVAHRRVPAELLDRPKMGFGIPIATWLRGPPREWADDLLFTERLKKQTLLDARVVRRAWDLHQTSRRDMEHQLWDVLMLQAWLAHEGMGAS